MKHSKPLPERLLHAYADGELSTEEKKAVLSRLETDESSRKAACDLQRTKAWVQFSFEGERAPTRTLPATHRRLWGVGTVRVAASLALLAVVFAAGWFAHGFQQPAGDRIAVQNGVVQNSRHVILHIGESNEALFSALLKKAERILDHYQAQGIQVEVVANAGGLDLVRTSVSHHADRIRELISNYPNVRFIACSKGLERLRTLGEDVTVVEGVHTDEPGADHLIQRLTEGWELLRI